MRKIVAGADREHGRLGTGDPVYKKRRPMLESIVRWGRDALGLELDMDMA